MSILLPRRVFIRALTGTFAVVVPGVASPAQSQRALPPVPQRGPKLSDEEVKGFVQTAHSDLDATRELLDASPTLIRAAWDWGGGDFETALGGASHMGRRDIASFLLERGAALDLFAAAMLGELSIVRVALEVRPALARVTGPHRITLLAHAKAGGTAAVPVLDYITGVLEQFERKA